VNLILTPTGSISRSKLRTLSPDGRCKTFAASADGYGQGEGCGIVVLKRLSDALAQHDNIVAVIRGSAVNHDGPSSGLTVPNGPAQEAVIRQALTNGRVDPAAVGYIEAHGTGTSLGDPIEMNALGRVFGPHHSPEHPLIVGSSKTNIGHLEAAAGVASLIKVALMLQEGEIPPHLHFHEPNPHIPWDELPVIIPTESRPWPRGEKPRLAGVSSFGISGTNAHVVLEEAPVQWVDQINVERPKSLLTLSAKTDSALKALTEKYIQYLRRYPSEEMSNICYTASTGRSHYKHRLATVSGSTEELGRKLQAFLNDPSEEIPGLVVGELRGEAPPKLGFLFTDKGSPYGGMGRELYDTQPTFNTFKQTLDQCAQILDSFLDRSLLEVLYPTEGYSPLNERMDVQPALFALEYSLAQLWMRWGIRPQILIGHTGPGSA
jgi:acyl transferase domain-containing protein